MFKQFILALGALVAATAFAAVDVNKASQAELESVKGIGPALSTADPRRAPEGSVQGLERPDRSGQGRGRRERQQVLAARPHRQRQRVLGPTAAGAAKAATAAGIKKKVDAAPAAKK